MRGGVITHQYHGEAGGELMILLQLFYFNTEIFTQTEGDRFTIDDLSHGIFPSNLNLKVRERALPRDQKESIISVHTGKSAETGISVKKLWGVGVTMRG
uniref:Uncharacterized protein n=1 Tax=Magnetococcus massalia (strain MO-1) TaxID=451514 RepID=A0A1S7LLE3_MAGMO|nr:protein of unknown function [Candidatus Magnetococcus massalia]